MMAYITCLSGLFSLLIGLGFALSTIFQKEYDDGTIRLLSISIGAIICGIVLLMLGIFGKKRQESDKDLCGIGAIASFPILMLSMGIGLVIAGSLFSQKLEDNTKWINIWMGAVIILFSILVPIVSLIKYYHQNKKEGLLDPEIDDIITD